MHTLDAWGMNGFPLYSPCMQGLYQLSFGFFCRRRPVVQVGTGHVRARVHVFVCVCVCVCARVRAYYLRLLPPSSMQVGTVCV